MTWSSILSAGQPETFPLHTDNMLWTLCSLLAALTCVSAVTVVTQQPSVVTLTRGETASIDCNLGSVTNMMAYWYKQIPGGVPHWRQVNIGLLWIFHLPKELDGDSKVIKRTYLCFFYLLEMAF
ncbi:unnamed protein product [Arctogadus glacialis]